MLERREALYIVLSFRGSGNRCRGRHAIPYPETRPASRIAGFASTLPRRSCRSRDFTDEPSRSLLPHAPAARQLDRPAREDALECGVSLAAIGFRALVGAGKGRTQCRSFRRLAVGSERSLAALSLLSYSGIMTSGFRREYRLSSAYRADVLPLKIATLFPQPEAFRRFFLQ